MPTRPLHQGWAASQAITSTPSSSSCCRYSPSRIPSESPRAAQVDADAGEAARREVRVHLGVARRGRVVLAVGDVLEDRRAPDRPRRPRAATGVPRAGCRRRSGIQTPSMRRTGRRVGGAVAHGVFYHAVGHARRSSAGTETSLDYSRLHDARRTTSQRSAACSPRRRARRWSMRSSTDGPGRSASSLVLHGSRPRPRPSTSRRSRQEDSSRGPARAVTGATRSRATQIAAALESLSTLAPLRPARGLRGMTRERGDACRTYVLRPSRGTSRGRGRGCSGADRGPASGRAGVRADGSAEVARSPRSESTSPRSPVRGARLTLACLDWSEQRPHLGGGLGAALLRRLEAIGGLERLTPGRAVRLLPPGSALLALARDPGRARVTRARERSRLGVALVAGAAVSWSTAGYFTHLIHVSMFPMLVWRNLFGGIFMFGFIAATQRGTTLHAFRTLGRVGWAVGRAERASAWSCTSQRCGTPRWPTWWSSMRRRRSSRQASRSCSIATGRADGRSQRASSRSRAWRSRSRVRPAPTGLLGDLFAGGMTLAVAIFTIVARRHRDRSMVAAAAASAFVGMVIALPFTSPSQLRVTPMQLVELALFGVTSFGLGLILYTMGARHLHAARSALISALDTPLAPLWVWLAFGLRPAVASVIGGAHRADRRGREHPQRAERRARCSRRSGSPNQSEGARSRGATARARPRSRARC